MFLSPRQEGGLLYTPPQKKIPGGEKKRGFLLVSGGYLRDISRWAIEEDEERRRPKKEAILGEASGNWK